MFSSMTNLSKKHSRSTFFKKFFRSSLLWWSIDLPEFSSPRRVEELTDSTIKYGLIPREEWVQPDWIDEEKARASREEMMKNNVIYGGVFWFEFRMMVQPSSYSSGSVPCVQSTEIFITLVDVWLGQVSQYVPLQLGGSSFSGFSGTHLWNWQTHSSSTDKKSSNHTDITGGPCWNAEFMNFS